MELEAGLEAGQEAGPGAVQEEELEEVLVKEDGFQPKIY